jgi:hypothetical protein
MDDDDHYGPNHLTDLTTAHTYSNADIVGKLASIVHISEVDLTVSRRIIDSEQYHDRVAGPTLTGLAGTVDRFRFLRRRSRVDTTLYQRIAAAGGRMYITHPDGFILERRPSGHTWHVDAYRHFVKATVESEKGVAKRLLDAG